jgi:hypothetical protein
MKKKNLVLGIACIMLPVASFAQSIEQPAYKPGDHWTYRMTTERAPSGWVQTRDEFTITRVTGSTLYFSVRQSGSTLPPNEVFSSLDWSRIRNVNGKETTVNRPLSFPLAAGKSWTLHYEEENPAEKNFKSQLWNTKYTVVGFETVEVPAGKFKALKIEAEGDWSGEVAPGQNVVQGSRTDQSGASMMTKVENTPAGTKVTGRTYKAFWYAPEVKRWVKSVEEYYNPGGARSARYTGELESFGFME